MVKGARSGVILSRADGDGSHAGRLGTRALVDVFEPMRDPSACFASLGMTRVVLCHKSGRAL